jgi:hypothetical protein
VSWVCAPHLLQCSFKNYLFLFLGLFCFLFREFAFCSSRGFIIRTFMCIMSIISTNPTFNLLFSLMFVGFELDIMRLKIMSIRNISVSGFKLSSFFFSNFFWPFFLLGVGFVRYSPYCSQIDFWSGRYEDLETEF